jgi:hypothetical protein
MTLRLASTSALRATADNSLAQGTARLRGFHLRASRYGGQVAATARQAFATAVAVMIFGSSSVLACPLCFGAEETSMVDGTKIGILILLAITLAVQGGFVGFFFYLRKRAKLIADADLDNEWSELQGSPKTS